MLNFSHSLSVTTVQKLSKSITIFQRYSIMIDGLFINHSKSAVFMPSPAISSRRHSVFRLSVRASVSDHILKVCQHDIV